MEAESKKNKPEQIKHAPMAKESGSVAVAPSSLAVAAMSDSIESQIEALQRMHQPQRQAALTQIGRLRGNQHVQRVIDAMQSVTRVPTIGPIQREGEGAAEGATTEAVAEESSDVPSEVALIPFDPNPLSYPGERILFNCRLSDPSPNNYKLVFTGTGGHFDSQTGPTSKTFNGLNSGNLSWFIPSPWDGTATVKVKLQVKRTSNNTVTNTKTWTFGKKTNIPTTINQTETEGERPLPSTYSYKVGPDLVPTPGDDYLHYTILETFGTRTCNIHMADLKPAFKTANPGITNDAQITAHFFGTSSRNGTFTVSAGDKIYDRHGGGMPDKATFEAALTTMKEIYVDLPQTYEAKPGVALGRYTVRRILKTDGSKKLKKMAKTGP